MASVNIITKNLFYIYMVYYECLFNNLQYVMLTANTANIENVI